MDWAFTKSVDVSEIGSRFHHSKGDVPMPRGASPKREREYKELVREFGKEGRYKGREEEVAARIVNKQRREKGETKTQRGQGGGGSSSRSKNDGSGGNGRSGGGG